MNTMREREERGEEIVFIFKAEEIENHLAAIIVIITDAKTSG